ncbi:MAG: scyllo-inosose 3-dehydrogenase [Fastidiosipilaceae bacterium]|jgi:threonine dehydrogenase-like Zn-dependent dehydrogenase
MRAFYVEAEWAPKEGYVLSEREKTTKRSARGSNIWKNIKGSVVDRPMPEPKEDEVLLKVGAAGICGTDAHLLQMDDEGYTRYNGHSKYPIIIGHEFSGEVISCGPKVKRLTDGDLVSVESMNWCGECDACRMGMFNQCQQLEEPGLTYDGGFAEYVVVREKYCYVLNDIAEYYGDRQVALELGALIEPTGVAYNGLFVRGGGFRPGSHAVVFGAGPVGLAAVALVKAAGCGKLIVFDTTPERMELAKTLGADYTFNPLDYKDSDEQAAHIMELTGNRGVGIFAECSGATKANYPVIGKSLAIGGKCVQIGHAVAQPVVDLYPFQFNAAAIYGSNGQSGQGIYSDIIAMMSAGRIDMRKMVTDRVHLEDIEAGIEKAVNCVSGKVLVSMDYDRI